MLANKILISKLNYKLMSKKAGKVVIKNVTIGYSIPFSFTLFSSFVCERTKEKKHSH